MVKQGDNKNRNSRGMSIPLSVWEEKAENRGLLRTAGHLALETWHEVTGQKQKHEQWNKYSGSGELEVNSSKIETRQGSTMTGSTEVVKL